MGIRRRQYEGEISSSLSFLPTSGFGEKKEKKNILNYKKYVNKIATT